MKPMCESPEVFEAYARIDCSYYLLREISKKLNKPVSTIERMVDNATGYDKAWLQSSIDLVNQIIEDKKIIDVDPSAELKILENLNKLLSHRNSQKDNA